MSKREGFVLFGDLPKVGPYLLELRARELAALVITGPPEQTLERRASELVHEPGGQLFPIIDRLAVQQSADESGVLAQVVEWSRQYEVMGLFCAAETFVEAAATAHDLLGLPGPGIRASRICRNKYLQRLYLSRWSPRSMLLSRRSALEAREAFAAFYPLVVKPLTLYSSKGVRLITDEHMLEDIIAGFAPETQMLLEERVTGQEFSVETIVVKGKPVYASITRKGTNEGSSPYFVEIAHTVPAPGLSTVQTDQILGVNTAVIGELSFGTGMMHAEYRLTAEGRVILMEVAARPGGDGILALCHLASGDSMEAALVATALGEAVHYRPPMRHARQVYLLHDVGRLQGVTAKDPTIPAPDWLVDAGIWPVPRPGTSDAPPAVRSFFVLKERGEFLPAVKESANRAVTLLFDARTSEELDFLESHILANIVIDVDN
jgi:ATP-grasp domain